MLTKIIVALDFSNEEQVFSLINVLEPTKCKLKIGKELFTSTGASLVRQVIAKGFDVFLDLKFHDIPNTVYKAISTACELGVWMVNVHASGGIAMMSAAKKAVDESKIHQPLLIGVTMLTSMSAQELVNIGVDLSVEEYVLLLAEQAKKAGLDGVVCSANEVKEIKQVLGADFLTVTPGIRCFDDSSDDQSRIMTPERAIQLGSDYLVIGRSITQASDPKAKLEFIYQMISDVIN